MEQVSNFLENIISVDDSAFFDSDKRRSSHGSLWSLASGQSQSQGQKEEQAQAQVQMAMAELAEGGEDESKEAASKTEEKSDKSDKIDKIDKIDKSDRNGKTEKDTKSSIPGGAGIEKNWGTVSDFWYLEDDQKKVSSQLSDRIIEKVLSVLLSTEISHGTALDPRTVVHKTRPPLSVHLMSLNSTQMAQKASPVFALIDEIAYSASWYNPWHTLGVVGVATVLILRPYWATALPPLSLITQFLVPSYARLYMPDPTIVDHRYIQANPVLHDGSPVRKYEAPKLPSQFSREFVMNFTDLQNHLVLYIRMYDAVVAWGQHYFLFEDSQLSTVVFIALVAITVFNVSVLPIIIPLILRVISLKGVFVFLLWSAAAMTHPYIQQKFQDFWESEEAQTVRRDHADRMENALLSTIAEDEEAPEHVIRIAEVFELHVLNSHKIWEPIGFTADFYALNHPKRHLKQLSESLDVEDHETAESTGLEPVSSDQSTESEKPEKPEKSDKGEKKETDVGLLKGIFRKATLAEIKAPKHWRFAEKSWQIDLDPVQWVNDSYIMDLVNVDTEEKWVYDFVNTEVEDEQAAASEDSTDGQIFRRRRWIRQCVRANESNRETKDILGVTSSERLSKTFTTLLS